MEETGHTYVRKIVMYYYLTIILVVALMFIFVPLDESIDTPIILLLSLYLLIYPSVFYMTLRYALHIFLFLLAFITGLYGFYHLSVEPHSLSNALYFTFRLYLLDFADVFTTDGTSLTKYPLLLEIARWSAASYTISTVFIAMYRTLEMKILLYRTQLFGNHYVIFGYNSKSHYLIEDLKSEKKTVIVIDEIFTPEAREQLEEMNVITLQMPMYDKEIFSKSSVGRANAILLFHPKDQDNLYLLMELEAYLEGKNILLNNLELYIHLQDMRYKNELQTFIKDVNQFSFSVSLFNIYEQLIAKFWKEHKDILMTEQPVHFLVVGTEKIGYVMINYIRNILPQLPTSSTLTILGETKIKGPNIRSIPFDEEADDLHRTIEELEGLFTHMFICMQEDYMDLMEGIDLSEIYPTIPIYMNFSNEMIDHTFTVVTTYSKKTLYSMGTVQDILTYQHLLLKE